MIVCDSLQKSLMFFHLVHPIGITNALAFTKSAESTLRLARLFEFFEVTLSAGQGRDTTQYKRVVKRVVMQDYSSDLNPPECRLVLRKFKVQKIWGDCLIPQCTEVAWNR